MSTCFSIASWSFHRLLESGQQDMFGYITDSKALGCSLLDPWNGHLVPLIQEDEAIKASANPLQIAFSPAGLEYVAQVKAAADAAGLPFGALAVDGAQMYETTPEQRQVNRALAYRWLDVAQRLGAPLVRMDSGGDAAMVGDMFDIIVEGFRDVVSYARERGIQVLIENHWGSSHVPENVLRILQAVEGLGLLFDSGNFAPGTRDTGWTLLTPYAKAVHIKTREFDEQGNEPNVDLRHVIHMLLDAGYQGCWGVESFPNDGDEMAGVRKSMALVQRVLAAR